MQLLDAIEDFCDTDPLVFLAIVAMILALLLAALLIAIFWPLDKIRIEDPMQNPFGDMPHLDRRSR